jgi:hypothetical protein
VPQNPLGIGEVLSRDAETVANETDGPVQFFDDPGNRESVEERVAVSVRAHSDQAG